MIKALQPLGALNILHILASYSDDGNVVVTVTIIPKDDKLADRARRTLQISGPVDEVEANLVKELTAGVDCVAKFQSNLVEIEQQNQKALEEAKGKPKPAAKSESKKKAKSEEPPTSPPPMPTAEEGGLDLGKLIDEAGAKK